MDFLVADYICVAVAVLFCVLGVFRGFSGSLAFFAASAAASSAVFYLWPWTSAATDVLWIRIAGLSVVALLAFGLARVIVKKAVNGLLAQPTDSIFGLILGAAVSVLLLAGWAYSGIHLEYSVLARQFSAVLSGR